MKLEDSQITWVSGTVAGLAATFAKQPIQRVKWIRQTADGPMRSYSSIVKETIAAKGWRGFFSGSSAAVLRNVPHSALVYTVYPHCANATTKLFGAEAVTESFTTRFVAGYITMILVTMVTHPLDTLRVRVSIAVNAESVRTAAKHLYRTEGVAGFYSGFNATLIGAGPRGAIGFGIFETLKPMAKDNKHLQERPALAKFLCGYLAGVFSETFVYPLDTVRRKQQAFGRDHPIGSMSTFAAIRQIIQTEGHLGLFKGISLNLIKNPCATAVSFAINDLVKDACGYGVV
ncbi:mitochondrial carrier domain-containing protein [Pelagophyceae sp. CCMP2097]|nr:mitochondrial carrier domain-containing protein [Pelagophyceae sp. CCMP2097]